MGCRESAVQTGDKGRTEMRWESSEVPGLKPGELLPGRWYEESLEPLRPEARVAARFADGSPAAVFSTFGRGKTLMLGSYVSAAYQSAPSETAARLFAGLLAWAGVILPAGAPGKDVEVRYLEAGADRLVFVFNHGKLPVSGEVSLRTGGGRYTAEDLVSAKAVEVRGGAGEARFDSSLGPDGVQVVRLRRQ
jgi:hypothetical protein